MYEVGGDSGGEHADTEQQRQLKATTDKKTMSKYRRFAFFIFQYKVLERFLNRFEYTLAHLKCFKSRLSFFAKTFLFSLQIVIFEHLKVHINVSRAF